MPAIWAYLENMHLCCRRSGLDIWDRRPQKKAHDAPFSEVLRGSVTAKRHTARAIIIFFTSAMAFAGFRPLGQVLAQFMIVWQR